MSLRLRSFVVIVALLTWEVGLVQGQSYSALGIRLVVAAAGILWMFVPLYDFYDITRAPLEMGRMGKKRKRWSGNNKRVTDIFTHAR